jgi:hypothetical protein
MDDADRTRVGVCVLTMKRFHDMFVVDLSQRGEEMKMKAWHVQFVLYHVIALLLVLTAGLLINLVALGVALLPTQIGVVFYLALRYTDPVQAANFPTTLALFLGALQVVFLVLYVEIMRKFWIRD